jgi:uncharacterized protein (DUF1697 family)
MAVFVALLRAVNVAGTGVLPMAELRAMAADAGFAHVETLIASGNLVFTSPKSEDAVREALEARLLAWAGKPIAVLVRTSAEMDAVLAGNPFAASDPRRTVVIFLPEPPPAGALDAVTGRVDEVFALGTRELYVGYPSGMGTSKLRIPAAARGTARNVNTVTKLCAMLAKRVALNAE